MNKTITIVITLFLIMSFSLFADFSISLGLNAQLGEEYIEHASPHIYSGILTGGFIQIEGGTESWLLNGQLDFRIGNEKSAVSDMLLLGSSGGPSDGYFPHDVLRLLGRFSLELLMPTYQSGNFSLWTGGRVFWDFSMWIQNYPIFYTSYHIGPSVKGSYSFEGGDTVFASLYGNLVSYTALPPITGTNGKIISTVINNPAALLLDGTFMLPNSAFFPEMEIGYTKELFGGLSTSFITVLHAEFLQNHKRWEGISVLSSILLNYNF